jgi:mRNA-degrading endonuclease RelE of RelBE toxin-antitoxin system
MFFGKEVRVMLKGQAKESYIELKKRHDQEAHSILNSIERIKEILKQNPQHGDPIPKRLIPDELTRQGIQNLYRVELSNYWRMIYTIEGNRVEILLFVLKIVDHKEYNKIFGYD